MRALDRVIAILEAVAAGPGPVSTAAVASQVGISLSTVSRLMRELAEQGLLDREGSSGTYMLGGRLMALVRTATEPSNLLRIALPVMESLRDKTQETVSLHVRSGDSRVCIAEVQSLKPVRRVVPLGLVLPLHFGATGEVLLAGLSPAAIQDYLARVKLPARDSKALQTRLDQCRKNGWLMAVDSWVEGLAGIAAQVRSSDTDVASLAVSGPSFRWTAAAMNQHREAVVAAAHTISVLMANGRA